MVNKKNSRTGFYSLVIAIAALPYCGSKDEQFPGPPIREPLVTSVTIDGVTFSDLKYTHTRNPLIWVKFSEPIQSSSLGSVSLKMADGSAVAIQTDLSNGDSVLTLRAVHPLSFLTPYQLTVGPGVQSASGGSLKTEVSGRLITPLDSSRKFPALSDAALLDTVQKRTFKYFWDYGHPISGLARERSNATPETVTTGGSGFGLMALVVGMERGFITKAEGLTRVQTIVGFLKTKAQRFHGAFPHWLNGSTGTAIPFSGNDNGADLVETSLLMMGLLTARQYFDGANAATLRSEIDYLWNAVEWDWFTQDNQSVLYWHWSPDKGWTMNHKISGWNECLITYVLAASSTTHPIGKVVYDMGWAQNGAIKNGNQYYNYTLPLGPNLGGPLFFAHYSFMGINPNGLNDAYANYQTQTQHHTLINYAYCKTNPKSYFGYGDSVWGLTASYIKGGYTASSPTNDQGYIAPTAAISSIPYTPDQSMAALKFYYYVLGDKLFKEYGFVDAFSLEVLQHNGPWFATSHLAIDQGPIIVMIENYRTGLLWHLFMSAPEVRAGLKKLGFNAPGL